MLELLLELLLGLVGDVARLADLLQDRPLGAQVLAQFVVVARDLSDRDVVEPPVDAGVDRDHLLLGRPRLVLRLVQRRDHPLAAGESALGGRVELGAELRERLELAVLREVEAKAPGDLLHRLRLRVPTDAGYGRADVDRRPHAREEEARLEEDLAVGDRDDVRRDVRGDVPGLRLDDRKRRERARAEVVRELARALEQPRVEIEDVAGECLAAGRAAEQERQLSVGVGVLREVVVDAERVLALVEEVLPHRAAGERRHPLDRGSLLRRSGDDDRVLHCTGVAEALDDLRDGGALLPDRDVDAHEVAAALVQDRVDRDRGLAGRAVADDELALATTDRGHRVDRLEPRVHRLLHGLSLDDARGLELEGAPLRRLDRAEPVERVAERVDDAAEEARADRNAHDLAGAAHRLALLHMLPLAEERNADVVLLEVERDPGHAVLEIEPLERDAVLETVDARDAIADLEDAADLREVGLDVELLDSVLEDRGDLFGAKFHVFSLMRRGEFMSETLEAAAHAAVGEVRPDPEDDPRDQVGVDGAAGLDRAAGRLLDLVDDRLGLRIGELVRRGELDREPVLRLRDERVELGTDLGQLAGPALLGGEADEVADELVGFPGELLEHLGLPSRIDLRVAKERAQLGHVVHRARERGEVGGDRVDAIRLLRGPEERAGVHALRDCH